MKRSFFLAPVFLLAAILGAGTADAISIRLSQEQIVGDSSEIVRGTVTVVRCEWNEGRTIIQTRVTVQITESWAGKLVPGSDVTLTVDGGKVGEMVVVVEHEPVFWEGEEVILFMQPDEQGDLRVTGTEQGKFTVAGSLVVGFDHRPEPLNGFEGRIQGTIRETKP